ncbi:hypothetical protein A3C98_02220 [Candidatus Roizmanbacteria bacterium RIFCSPHIGHO2_02_FULL_37_15]|nr:MAG: hypothetical protein A3C98_02220 [Candidatus Roizmanbacteria bacterium RIFCSPHIGHO2_02_FULL_37_15]
MTKVKRVAPIIFLSILFAYIFFYRLDYNTLESFDEAWYASIAREIAKTGDFMNLVWNGKPYYDHPPMGFWLMAISYKLFGVNEFATRFPSAILGLFSIYLVYKIGSELLGKKTLGFASSLILGTSVWYVIRVRSGNLESAFMFFYLLTLFLSLKAKKNFNFFPLTLLSFGALILTKTLIGFSAGFFILFFNIREILNIKKNFVLIFIGFFLFTLLVVPWYRLHLEKYPDFYQYHFIHKGARDKTLNSYFQLKLEQPLFYIHMGMRKWYRLWQISLPLVIFNCLLIFFKKKKKQARELLKINIFLILWNFIILYPFLTSEQTELWHLIPTYLPMAFLIPQGFYYSGQTFFDLIFKKTKYEFIFNIFFLLGVIYLAGVQIFNFRKEVFPQSKYETDQVDIVRKVLKYNKKIFLDIDYLPVAVFYSGRKIETLIYEASGEATFARLFETDGGNVVGITKNWVIEDLEKKKFPFKLLEKNNTYSIISKL